MERGGVKTAGHAANIMAPLIICLKHVVTHLT